MIRSIRDSLLSLAFPQNCRTCSFEVESYDFGSSCSNCWENTRILSGRETACPKCGRILSFTETGNNEVCHRCDGHSYDGSFSAGIYELALRTAVLDLKTRPFLCRKAKGLFNGAFIRSGFYDSSIVVPVPLSRRRRLERGFNQAEHLAASISRGFGIDLQSDGLQRDIHTPLDRKGMDIKARAATVQNAFSAGMASQIEGARVLLIDDVFTSGATASACADALKRSGARRVYVLTLARKL